MADFAGGVLNDPTDPRYKGAVGIEQALEFHISQQTKKVESLFDRIQTAKVDVKEYQSGLADHHEDHAEALSKLNKEIRTVEDELSEIVPSSVYPNLLIDGDDAEIYDEGAAEAFEDALNALDYKETQEVVRLQDKLRNLRTSKRNALEWDKGNIQFHELGIAKNTEVIANSESELEEAKAELARLIAQRPEDGYLQYKEQEKEAQKNDNEIEQLRAKVERLEQENHDLVEKAEKAERAKALLESERREVSPAQRDDLDQRNTEERQATYRGNKTNREYEFQKTLPFVINWIKQAADEKSEARFMLRGWKPKQSIAIRAGINVDDIDILQVRVLAY